MKSLRSKIIKAIAKGLNEAFQFDLNDYNSEDCYISKKKQDLDKNDREIRVKYEFNGHIKKLCREEVLTEKEKEDFLLAILLGCTYKAHDFDDFEDNLSGLIKQFCMLFGWESDLNWIDVSNVTDFNYLFNDLEKFNGDITKWDVSNATTMEGMFDSARSFNLPIGDWDVSNVENMSYMFKSAINFNLPIGKWNVSHVKNMSKMFAGAGHFNLPIGDWDVSKVKDFMFMFSYACSFNQDISNWDIFEPDSYYNNSEWVFKNCPIKEEYKPRKMMLCQ